MIDAEEIEQFKEISDLYQGTMSGCTHFLTSHGTNQVTKVQASGIFHVLNYPTKIESGDTKLYLSGNQILGQCEGQFQITQDVDTFASQIRMYLRNVWFNNVLYVNTTQGYPSYFRADGFVEYSSEMYKTDIGDIPDAVEKVAALRARSFKIKGKEKYGFITEETAAWAKDRDSEGVEGINLGSLVAALCDTIQHLETRLKILEEKLQ